MVVITGRRPWLRLTTASSRSHHRQILKNPACCFGSGVVAVILLGGHE